MGFNERVRRACERHADTHHHDCPVTGETTCSYWCDIGFCPDCGEWINPDMTVESLFPDERAEYERLTQEVA